jgi:hypothetical protein
MDERAHALKHPLSIGEGKVIRAAGTEPNWMNIDLGQNQI